MDTERSREPPEEAGAAAAAPQESAEPECDSVDEASYESFPASDPPAFNPSHAGTPGEHPD